MDVQKIAKNTISDIVANELKKIILNGTLKPGERLPTEQELSERFGVGRTTVREALKALSAIGLIYREKQATFVKEASDNFMLEPLETLIALKGIDTVQIFEARIALELTLVGVAAERHSAEDLEEIKRTHLLINTNSTAEDILDANIQFHLAVANGSKNIILIELLTSMVELLRHTQKKIIAQPGVINHIIHDHTMIVDAISNHDAAMATEAMKAHLENALQKHLHFECFAKTVKPK